MGRSSLFPGFRFHPTDHELVMYYLKRKLLRKKIVVNAVAEVNIYDFSPWDLPDKSALKSGDLEWFFFCPKSKKYTSGSRSNRATEKGFWKATGKERTIEYNGRTVATIKTLVFHLGHASDGERTNWVMHEYNMKDQKLADEGIILDMYVLCKIFEKEGVGPKNGAQYGAPFKEEEWDDDVASCSGSGPVIGPDGPTNKPEKGPASLSLTEQGSSTVTFSANHKQKSPSTMKKIVPQSTCSLSVTEPGSVTVASSANVTHVDTPAYDDVIFLEDIDTVMVESTDELNCNNKIEVVGVDNGKEVKGVGPNEEHGIYGNLDDLLNLDALDSCPSNMLFKANGAEYTLDMIMRADDLVDVADDLDVDLGRFWVD